MPDTITPMTQAMQGAGPVPRRELKQLMKRSNKPGLIHLFWWFVLLTLTCLLITLSSGNPWLLVPAMFLHGIVVVHHFALQHECSHFTAFRSRRLCRFLNRYCGFLLVIPPLFFRYEHCDHHTHTNIIGKDPELIELPKSRWEYFLYLSAVTYWYSQFAGMFRRATGKLTKEERRFVPATEIPAVIRESRVMIAGYLGIIVISLLAGSTIALIYWWLPMFMAEPVMRFIRMTEHVGRPNVADLTRNTRSNLVSAPWRFLAWNMNYHAEHHFAASVPFYALKDLHEKLQDTVYVEKHGYLSAHKDILSRITSQNQNRPI